MFIFLLSREVAGQGSWRNPAKNWKGGGEFIVYYFWQSSLKLVSLPVKVVKKKGEGKRMKNGRRGKRWTKGMGRREPQKRHVLFSFLFLDAIYIYDQFFTIQWRISLHCLYFIRSGDEYSKIHRFLYRFNFPKLI